MIQSQDHHCALGGPSESGLDEKEQRRRMKLFQRLGLFGEDLKGAVVQRAVTYEQLLSAYQLTHDLFVEQGYIKPDPTGIRVRCYEALPDTATYVAATTEQIVAVTTVVVDSDPFGLPAEHAFPEEIEGLRSQGMTVHEGTNWLVRNEYRRSGILGELLRTCMAHGVLNECDEFLACVSPGHAALYEVVGFRQIGTERSYSKDIYDPVVLMSMDMAKTAKGFDCANAKFLNEYGLTANPYFQKIPVWEKQARAGFRDVEMLRKLFVERTDLLDRLMVDNHEHFDAVRRRWGQDANQKWIMDQVLGTADDLVELELDATAEASNAA